ncbi:ANL_HP_G0201660.mRNA.1.CDS.1 [Saccharomyces cerevisiae]|nr:ANL_HP_G0201660.mRNA.1.CDS.1 [Saccharomyces cerevisiae]CAI6476660.1 ANL_HP_G0201660.mRNA.1.CDS.1 [Saccharomyces cerevisiae]
MTPFEEETDDLKNRLQEVEKSWTPKIKLKKKLKTVKVQVLELENNSDVQSLKLRSKSDELEFNE